MRLKTTPAALGSYEALLASTNVDAVYIPLPTGLAQRMGAARGGGGQAHHLRKTLRAPAPPNWTKCLPPAQKQRVQFMDGVMFMHSPRLAKIREVLDDGKNVGQIRRISSAFSFYAGEEFFNRQHPRGWRAGTGRLSWRSGLVLHPFRALDDELATAARSHGKNSFAVRLRRCRRNSPANCFMTVAFPSGFYCSFLAAQTAMGACQRAERLAACAGFCPSAQQL